MNEIWKDIIGYEGVYQVSNLGKVKSLKRNGRNSDKILKQGLNSHRYLLTSLSKNGKSKTKMIHKLVAEAFLNHTSCGRKLVVDHIDNNKINNKLDNLQIITQRENVSKDKENCSSIHTGVSWYKQVNKWRSYIVINGKFKHLGFFTNELKASEAYQNALSNIIDN